jgi:hypothetical protein
MAHRPTAWRSAAASALPQRVKSQGSHARSGVGCTRGLGGDQRSTHTKAQDSMLAVPGELPGVESRSRLVQRAVTVANGFGTEYDWVWQMARSNTTEDAIVCATRAGSARHRLGFLSADGYKDIWPIRGQLSAGQMADIIAQLDDKREAWAICTSSADIAVSIVVDEQPPNGLPISHAPAKITLIDRENMLQKSPILIAPARASAASHHHGGP